MILTAKTPEKVMISGMMEIQMGAQLRKSQEVTEKDSTQLEVDDAVGDIRDDLEADQSTTISDENESVISGGVI